MSNNKLSSRETISDKYSEIQSLYLKNNLPWVIGYSGGKDSTTILQLIWEAVSKLPLQKRKKRIFVISTDTLVESPILYRYIINIHSKLKKAAIKQNLPFEIVSLKPSISESFWVNIIGKGYPAPTQMFRWCTNRLKIKPSDRFIFDKVDQFGEAIVVLGLRIEESPSRARSIKAHKIKDSLLSKHGEYPQILVYTPIENFAVDDVWKYLLTNKSPWGANNEELFEMYSNGSFSECAFAIDNKTKTCGGTRFGCWTCTLVKNDTITESMVATGHDWMRKLSEIRKLLYTTTIPENKPKYRELKGRNGQIRFKSDGSGKIARGPYKFSFSKELLTKILEAQKELEEKFHIKDFKLIQSEELAEIRRLWLTERGDWEDSLPKIYADLFKTDFNIMNSDYIGRLSGFDKETLSRVARETGLPLQLLTKLIDVEVQSQGMKRRANIYSKINKIFKEDWRSEEEVINSMKTGAQK
jgi:DNA sulfur modification protein DndC